MLLEERWRVLVCADAMVVMLVIVVVVVVVTSHPPEITALVVLKLLVLSEYVGSIMLRGLYKCACYIRHDLTRNLTWLSNTPIL